MNSRNERIKQEVRSFYDSLASNYYSLRNDKGFEKRKRAIKELCDKFDFKTVLDLGTANSEILREVVVDGTIGIGMDLSSGLLRLGVMKNKNDRKNVSLLQGDANFIPIKDDSIDLIVCSELLEHIPNPQKVIREMKRVLKKKSYVIITIPNNTLSLFFKIADILRLKLPEGYKNKIGLKSLKKKLEEEFQIVDVSGITFFSFNSNIIGKELEKVALRFPSVYLHHVLVCKK